MLDCIIHDFNLYNCKLKKYKKIIILINIYTKDKKVKETWHKDNIESLKYIN